jgi:uncharacterized protein
VKRKFTDRAHWRRVTERRFAVQRVDSDLFTGYLTLFWIDRVREPLWVPFRNQMICVADTGHCWLQLLPDRQRHVLTAMYDADGRLVQWYVDLVRAHGVDERGIPWYDDLYLDVIALPNGEVEIIDGDELEAALAAGLVTPEEYRLTWREATHLRDAIETGEFGLLQVAETVWRSGNFFAEGSVP